MMNNWQETENTHYYYNEETGRILGVAYKYANQNIVWCSKIYKDNIPFTNDNEYYLGQFINLNSAKKSIEHYWEVQNRTLLN